MAGISGWLMLGESMSWHSWLAMLVTLTGIAISILARGGEQHKLTPQLPLKGVLFGIGAGVGQGVGLVLSKIGLDHYAQSIPAEAPQVVVKMMPFAGTYIRAVAGFVGFFLILALTKQLHLVGKGLHDRKGMTFAALTTFFGPFLGVSLSLMAVQYAKAGIASTLMALTPVLIIVPYALIHKQKISVKEVIGTLITMVGGGAVFLGVTIISVSKGTTNKPVLPCQASNPRLQFFYSLHESIKFWRLAINEIPSHIGIVVHPGFT